MSLRKQKGNMYDFVSHTWNPIKGRCEHDCEYCYMKRWGEQPKLHLDEKCLNDDLGKGNTIFVGSSTDMFADGVPGEWIRRSLMHCRKYSNEYFYQSKNPQGFKDYLGYMPLKLSLCITIETNRDYPVMGNTPFPSERALIFGSVLDDSIEELRISKFVTIEPIMDFDLKELLGLINLCNPEQVNIGADSQRNNLPEPSAEKVLELVAELRKNTKVHLKKNLKRIGDIV